ncbi:MAG: ribose-phosphate pyrophosphokinase-like domain-containing protein, partial [Spirochaetales bacterium]|nr:ribose-phosphate pyrophosphokinase-like domain-containing protein [Spirochaetales bacterium]
MKELVIVGSASENAFVEDIAHHLNQHEDYLDIISLKTFLNTEFCPRFIIDQEISGNIGNKLAGREVMIISTSFPPLSRDELAMRNFLIARAAKDNGADRVILLEPDLFYSAQDRGPRLEHGFTDYDRSPEDFGKFDGQPFSARLYAELLKQAGVDEVVTVHNHSTSVEKIFLDRFSGKFHNLKPAD